MRVTIDTRIQAPITFDSRDLLPSPCIASPECRHTVCIDQLSPLQRTGYVLPRFLTSCRALVLSSDRSAVEPDELAVGSPVRTCSESVNG